MVVFSINDPVYPYAIGFEPPEEQEELYTDDDFDDEIDDDFDEDEDEEVEHIDSFER